MSKDRNFQTPICEKKNPKAISLIKFEALLFGDEVTIVSKLNPEEKLGFKKGEDD